MKKLVGLPDVLAVYEYKLPYEEIPLVFVENDIDRDVLRKEFGRSKGCILITEDDLKDGRDVFGLRFLHMQERSEHIGGKKILEDLKIKKESVRHEMEGLLRLLLIDLREMILLPEVHHTTHKMLAIALDRILVGVIKFGKKHHKLHELQLGDAIDHCRKHIVDHKFLKELYDEIEELTKKVDDE